MFEHRPADGSAATPAAEAPGCAHEGHLPRFSVSLGTKKAAQWRKLYPRRGFFRPSRQPLSHPSIAKTYNAPSS
jgi:hypothetical protein